MSKTTTVKCPDCGDVHDDPDSLNCGKCNCRTCGGTGNVSQKQETDYWKNSEKKSKQTTKQKRVLEAEVNDDV